MSITPAQLKVLRVKMQAALESVATEMNLSLRVGNMSYTHDTVTIKVEGATIGDNGVANSNEASDFKSLATYYGLKPEDLNREFISTDYIGTKTYTIVGIKPKSRKYPILVVDKRDGKTYKLPAAMVVKALYGAEAAKDHAYVPSPAEEMRSELAAEARMARAEARY